MLPVLTASDLEPFADIESSKADAMIEDATAMAVRVAPCIAIPAEDEGALSEADQAAVKAIVRNAILRWNDAGTGSLAGLQQAAGSFQVSQTLDTRSPRRGLLWPTEIADLQAICSDGSASGAYEVNSVPEAAGTAHADICSINLGATYCTCGAILTQRLPLYEKVW